MENIDKEHWKRIGKIPVTGKFSKRESDVYTFGSSKSDAPKSEAADQGYMELTVENYRDWAATFNKERVSVHDIKKIKKSLYEKLIDVTKEEALDDAKSVKGILEMIDDTILKGE